MMNENIFAAIGKGSMIRNTLLIDSLFRAIEIIRSIKMIFDMKSKETTLNNR